jgi:hypothetical protein
MFLLKSSFPIFIGKISLSLLPLLFFSSLANAQVKTGIYKVDDRTDRAFINACFRPYKQQNTNPDLNISTFYNYQYKPLLDTAIGVKYVVVINKNDPDNKEYYPLQMVWLNQHSPDNFHITYSDSVIRKFVGMELYIGKKRNYWNPVRPFFNNGFIWNQAFDDYSADDSYRYKLSDSNFYSDKNLFILKSKKFELVSDSVKVDSSTSYTFHLKLNSIPDHWEAIRQKIFMQVILSPLRRKLTNGIGENTFQLTVGSLQEGYILMIYGLERRNVKP